MDNQDSKTADWQEEGWNELTEYINLQMQARLYWMNHPNLRRLMATYGEAFPDPSLWRQDAPPYPHNFPFPYQPISESLKEKQA